ncbi:MAG: helix-turn-helix transcriptional regulator [Clostridiales bacterium]|jgi:transcriptional regulator with XRE-family HTH domain|nr:helix-turn-helix transcriptional regulator [Clostridiales bacterium]
MENYSSDILIKTLRIERGITQKELAEGICSQDTISRIERGERLPDWHTFDKIMQKLGEDPHKYYKSVISADERRYKEFETELNYLVRTKAYLEAEKRLDEHLKGNTYKKGFELQTLLQCKAACLIGRALSGAEEDKASINGNEAEEAYKYSIKALSVFRPNFDENKIDTYVLSLQEMNLINTLAIIYSKLHGVEKTAEVFMKLKTSIDNNTFIGAAKKDVYLQLLSNLCQCFVMMERFDECLTVCDDGAEYCAQVFDAFYHPKFIANKSICLLALGRIEEAAGFIKQACYLYKGQERDNELNGFIKNITDKYGIEVGFEELKIQSPDKEEP